MYCSLSYVILLLFHLLFFLYAHIYVFVSMFRFKNIVKQIFVERLQNGKEKKRKAERNVNT